ncbi:MAG: hypothetical protein ABIA04_15880 [Pseudomonadota bacterium]
METTYKQSLSKGLSLLFYLLLIYDIIDKIIIKAFVYSFINLQNHEIYSYAILTNLVTNSIFQLILLYAIFLLLPSDLKIPKIDILRPFLIIMPIIALMQNGVWLLFAKKENLTLKYYLINFDIVHYILFYIGLYFLFYHLCKLLENTKLSELFLKIMYINISLKLVLLLTKIGGFKSMLFHFILGFAHFLVFIFLLKAIYSLNKSLKVGSIRNNSIS